ncbi:hypothetical protein B0T37_10520 [Chromobacterium violaceum]|uniref:DUF4055 domain-containing protein n=1 Tax=Chromobacterium violaceum TaxID=536 RepID=UPI0009DB356F|nr:DUF4055 domain-containing protein [Chromobacterium violaceum]OQS10074.1 hypothetical protein B0T38_10915 [Chromobacterium violaceum]OQS26489.1 hypothetical protein B0T37_10520 [Chromobacterium violaceum]
MSDVSTQSPAIKAMAEDWPIIDALMGGTKAMRAAGEMFMPRWPLEDRQEYDARLKTATLYPALSETVEQMIGRVFGDQISRKDVPQRIEDEVLLNVDREGRSLDVFAAAWFGEALQRGVSYLLVNYPRVEGARTMADEKAAGARPYWCHISPKSVLGWKTDKSGGSERLVQFRYLEQIEEPDGEFGVKVIKQIVVLEPGRCRLYREAGADWSLCDEFEMTAGSGPLKDIPLIPLYTKRTGFLTGKPPLLELAHLNVKHWQSQSDQDTILHTARVPILARIGAEPQYDHEGRKRDDMQIGKSLIDLPLNGDMKYVEHTGAAIVAGKESLADLEEQMKVAGAKLLTRSVLAMTDSQARGESLKEISQLRAMANALEDSIAKALDYTAMWMGLGDNGGEVEISGNIDADFDPSASMDVLVKMGLSPETMFSEAKRRGLISESLTWADELERRAGQPPLGAM